MEELLIRYLHFIGIIVLSGTLITENILIAKNMDTPQLKRIASLDRIYGLAAILTFCAGLLLWLYVGKPKSFYSDNMIFHIKLGLFVLIALISIIPTLFFIKHRNQTQPIMNVPGVIILLKRIELILLLAMPAFAVLIARGVGLG